MGAALRMIPAGSVRLSACWHSFRRNSATIRSLTLQYCSLDETKRSLVTSKTDTCDQIVGTVPPRNGCIISPRLAASPVQSAKPNAHIASQKPMSSLVGGFQTSLKLGLFVGMSVRGTLILLRLARG